MKISINSTFSYIKFNLNYGSTLQCYAMQKYLKNRGHEPEHLRDYRAHPLYIIKRLKNIRYFRGFCAKTRAIIRVQKFIKKHMSFSKRGYLSESALKRRPPQVDCHIVGSDQIWHNDNRFRYLNYAPEDSLKLSYAASFGRAEISDEMKENIKPLLQRFDGISVREKSAVDIISSMDLKSQWVLDPTLLIDSDEYPCEENSEKNYFYCYFLNLADRESVHFSNIKQISKEIGKELKVSAPLNYMQFPEEKTIFPRVEEWLGLYKNADCIFTNTYHGLLFCIIFKKQFIFFPQHGEQEVENERFYSLLKLLPLEDRLVSFDTSKETIADLINKKIDYDKVYETIFEQRKITDNFFKQFGI